MNNTEEAQGSYIRIGDKVRIRPRGKRGIYTAEFWHNGQHHKRSLKTANGRVARQRAVNLEAELASGEYATPVKPLTVASAVSEYMMVIKGKGRKPKTVVKYQGWLDRFVTFCEISGAVNLQALTPQLFERFEAECRKSLTAKTISNGLIIIKQLVKWASADSRRYLAKNPFTECRVEKVRSAPAFTPSTAQVQALLDVAEGERKLQFAVLAMTGLRAGELSMLRVRDVDIERGWIHVTGHSDWNPKTASSTRKVPIHPKLAEMLAAAGHRSGPYFFCASPSPKYPEGGHHINIKHLNEDLQKLAKQIGAPVGRKNQGFVVHSLRHYFETQCVDAGTPQFMVDAWMGHTSVTTMGRTYYGLNDAKSQGFMKLFQF